MEPSGGDPPPLRILHVIDRLSTSGTETSLRELLPSLQSPDLDHGITVLWPDRNDLSDAQELGIPCFVPTGVRKGRLARIRHVRLAIREFQPDLLHTSLFESDLVGRISGLLTRTPALTSLVNMPYADAARPSGRSAAFKHRGVKWIDGVLGRHATFAFHAVTEAVAAVFVTDLGLAPERILVVPRGRRLDRLGEPSEERRSRVRSSLGIRQDASVILAVGRQEPQKNHETLIAAIPKLRETVPDALLLVAGRPGRSTPHVTELVERLGIGDAVRMLGYRDDVGDLLAAADVFAFPSLYEGAGGAALEAMALEVPILASDILSLRDLLQGGRLGLLVDPLDQTEMAEGLIAVLANPAAAGERAEAARTRFLESHTLEASAEGMKEMYREVGERLRVAGRRVSRTRRQVLQRRAAG